jgi:hypothetical protein
MIDNLRTMTVSEIKIYTESCRKIVRNGNCNSISCKDCPFHQQNTINNKSCTDNEYFKWENPDFTLINNANNFIKEMS